MMNSGNTILAAMISPAMLYAGLACAAIPILIHLLSKRRFRRVRWAAMEFLMEANRQNRRRVRLEELILLALRCLAMLLIGMVLARFFVRPQTLAAIFGSTAGTRHIVLLDDSFSMGLLDPADQDEPRDASVFDRALTAVERLVTRLKEESANDHLAILSMSHPDQPILPTTPIANLDLMAFHDQWRSRRPSARRADTPRAAATARQMLDADTSAVDATLYVVGDFQRNDWLVGSSENTTRPADAGRPPTESANPLSALVGWSHDGRSLRTVLVDAGSSRKANLCITAVEPRRAQPVAGLGSRFAVCITNYSTTESSPSSLRVYLGEAGQPPVPVPAIGANQTLEVPIEVTFPQAGSAALTAELPPDALPIDNTRWCVVPVVKALRVLIVNGEPSPDPYEDEVFLPAAALHPQGPQFSGNDVTVIEDSTLDQADLASFHMVILANVTRVSETVAGRLEAYVAAGGGLAVFAGDQIDLEAYNRLLFREGTGLLPALLGEPVGALGDDPGRRVAEVNVNHPALRPFRDLLPTCFEGVAVWGHFTSRIAGTDAPADPAAGSSPPADSAPAAPDDAGRDSTTILVRLNDAEHSPLLMQRDLGRGHVWLMTTSVDKEWNNLPDQPVFVVLMMEMVQYLARQPQQVSRQLVGRPIELTLDPGRYQPNATVRTPAYPEEPLFPVTAQLATDNTLSIRWPQTEQPGLYQFDLADQAGSRVIEQAAINVDTAESDLQRADATELLQATASLAPQYVTARQLADNLATGSRRELWPVLLALLTAVLMTEQSLAWWFGSNRRLAALLGGSQA